MTIEIDELVLQSLQKLKRQAEERRLPLHQYLEQLADTAPPTAGQDITAEELEAAFDELDNEPDVAESLPPDFSRADIYFDHD